MTRKLHLVYPEVYEEMVFAFADKLKEAETGGYHHSTTYESARLRNRISLSSSASYPDLLYYLYHSSHVVWLVLTVYLLSQVGRLSKRWNLYRLLSLTPVIASSLVFLSVGHMSFLIITQFPHISNLEYHLSHPPLLDRVFAVAFFSSPPFAIANNPRSLTPQMAHIVSYLRISGRNPEWLALMQKNAIAVVATTYAINVFPKFMHP